jgi:hypothetical protein
MSIGYKIAAALVVALFFLAFFGSYYGWGLTSDSEAKAKSRSVRSGSAGGRFFYGGGGGFGK